MATYQITCIRKTDRYNPHERIQFVGLDYGTQRVSVDVVLKMLDAGDEFFVSVGGYRVRVIPATHNGRRYIKTVADGEQPNNLLSLPECI